jgi:hypothetical protein
MKKNEWSEQHFKSVAWDEMNIALRFIPDITEYLSPTLAPLVEYKPTGL